MQSTWERSGVFPAMMMARASMHYWVRRAAGFWRLAAIEGGRLIAGAAQDKIAQITNSECADSSVPYVTDKVCSSYGQAISLGNVFCGGCGSKVAAG